MEAREIESRLMELFWKMQLSQWENYVHGGHHDLNAIDEQIIALLSPHQNVFGGHSRRDRVWRAISKRPCVDCHQDTARLRNRMDDCDNYTRNNPYTRDMNPVRFRQLL